MKTPIDEHRYISYDLGFDAGYKERSASKNPYDPHARDYTSYLLWEKGRVAGITRYQKETEAIEARTKYL